MKKYFSLLSLVVLIFVMVGFAAFDAEAADGDIVIAALINNLADENTKFNAEGIEARAKELGVECIINDGKNDLNTQISQAEDMIIQGVDAIILHAISSEGSSVVVDMCNEANIPVVVMNLSVESEDYTSYVGVYDVYAGEMQGNYVSELLGGKGNIAIIEGVMGQGAQILRDEGLSNTILKEEGINLLAQKTGNWSRADAMALTEDWLTSYPDLNAILCHNDDMAMGALLACEAAGRDDIIIAGVDAIPDALEAIQEGRMDVTVFQNAKEIGGSSLETAVKLAKGETVEKDNYIDFELVTPENIADYIGINK
ncbi:MAG: substrate-binding domain-containing protein [Flexilinea sp.]